MKELITFIAQSLVNHPEHVAVQETKRAEGLHYELKVSQADIGQVIGKNGRIAKAIRSVIIAAATKKRQRVSMHISEGEGE